MRGGGLRRDSKDAREPGRKKGMQAPKSTRRDRNRKGVSRRCIRGRKRARDRRKDGFVAQKVYGGKAGTKMNRSEACLCLIVELGRVGMCIDADAGGGGKTSRFRDRGESRVGRASLPGNDDDRWTGGGDRWAHATFASGDEPREDEFSRTELAAAAGWRTVLVRRHGSLHVFDKALQRRESLLLDIARVGLGAEDTRRAHNGRGVARSRAGSDQPRGGRVADRLCGEARRDGRPRRVRNRS
jgi:hypothetical protein